jgi:filamentous hemagglutinin family protein
MAAERHHSFHVSFCVAFSLFFSLFLFSATLAVAAGNGVKLDGSFGQTPGTVAGGTVNGALTTYLITDTLGTKAGGNLFFSFGSFNIYTKESATFYSPNGSSYNNIISRVTGGSPSTIDGLLMSTIVGANLYLMNPSGVMFGPNASLDVKGSFHVSTADYLKFSDGGVFYADPAKSSVLSVAEPQAFGFLSANPAAISLDRSVLTVPDGQTLSIIAGDISIQNDPTSPTYNGSTYYTLSAPGGRINLVSVASPGEVNLSTLDIGSFTKMGNITVSNGANMNVSSSDGTTPAGSVFIRGGQIVFQGSTIDASGNPGGTIDVKGDTLQLDNSFFNIFTNADTPHPGTACQVELTGDFIMKNSSSIDSSSYGTGRGGDIRINAGNVMLGDDSPGSGPLAAYGIYGYIQSGSFMSSGPCGNISIISASDVVVKNGFSISAGTGGQGNAGNITISAGNEFVMKNESFIDSSTWGAGRGGDIQITAKNITLGDDAPGITLLDTYDYFSFNPYGFIRSWSDAPGLGGGNISITANNLTVKNGFYIGTSALDQGNAGNVTVSVDTLQLLDQGNIFSNAVASGTGGIVNVKATDIVISATNEAAVTNTQQITGIGAQTSATSNGGKIIVNTDTLQILDGGQISTILFGSGHGADVEVTAKNILISGFVLDPSLTPVPYGLSAIDARVVGAATAGGIGGNITVTADNLTLANGGAIRTNLFEDAPGKAGNITVNAGAINISSGGQIYADSFSGTGDSGDLNITADSMSISGFGGSQAPYPVPDFTGLSTTTNAGRGGTINVTLAGDLTVTGRGGIKADTQGTGTGGTINISAQNITLSDQSAVNSSSTGTEAPGNAGDITITAGNSILMRDSSITTESVQADGGDINISTPYMVKLDNSKITASVGGGPQTTGGNITIDPQFVTLENSQIIANAYEGRGGNIKINTNVFLADPQSIVDASSALGINGTVDIRAPITDVSGLLNPLSSDFVSAAALLRERCMARIQGSKYSSFVVGSRDGLPIEPGNLMPGFLH